MHVWQQTDLKLVSAHKPSANKFKLETYSSTELQFICTTGNDISIIVWFTIISSPNGQLLMGTKLLSVQMPLSHNYYIILSISLF